MRKKLIVCLGMVSLLVLFINISPLYSQRAGCDIGIHVQDDEGNPKANTPVKLTSLTYGGYVILNTESDGVAVFGMSDWPNSCPSDACCPPTWNYGRYRAEPLFWCESEDFVYNTNNKHVDVVVGIPCD